MYTLTIKQNAIKYLSRLPKNVRDAIQSEIDRLAIDPDDLSLDIQPIKGTRYLRLRFRKAASDYRAIYTKEDDIQVICILKISPRGQAYNPRRLRP